MRYVLTIILCLPITVFAFQSVRIQVIDVGQGDGILIRTPNSHWVLIDAGTGKNIADALPDWGVDKLDLAIVSHRHFDHQGGMDNVINSIEVDSFIGITEDCLGVTSDDKVRQAISDHSVDILDLNDDPITIDGVTFTVLPLPLRHRCPDHENNNSVIIRVDYGDFSMLFTGDSEEDERDWLVDNHADMLNVDVLKASHHGSHNGTSQTWLDKVTPSRVVISSGVNGRYKHPHSEAVTAYLDATSNNVYCTNRHGTVRVYGYQDGRIRISKQRQNNKSCVYDGTWY